jgi:hypothetical protein
MVLIRVKGTVVHKVLLVRNSFVYRIIVTV